jgi:hypothetical protein
MYTCSPNKHANSIPHLASALLYEKGKDPAGCSKEFFEM